MRIYLIEIVPVEFPNFLVKVDELVQTAIARGTDAASNVFVVFGILKKNAEKFQ